jgi:hypothetical protein
MSDAIERCRHAGTWRRWLFFTWFLTGVVIGLGDGAGVERGTGPYQKWSRGPSSDADYFPLAVWLQSPARAEAYQKAGINTYVGLWRGPTEEQLAVLKRAGMKLICGQNEVALRHVDDPTIIGWMHGDEPDNAQSLGAGKGYGPPILPSRIVEDYGRMRAKDPTRPVLLNLGQGVAWDDWIGRGVRRNRPEDYPEYVAGCDIASFDIYPVVHPDAEVAGNLWYVARGVERLVEWAGPERVVWNCLECTRISNLERKPTPGEVRAEAWMSLIHGSRGLIYFVHQFEPTFNEAALLDDAEMLAAVSALNRQIAGLAPVLNSRTIPDLVSVASSDPEIPIKLMVKRHESGIHVFAVAMRSGTTTAVFTVNGLSEARTVQVLDEERTIQIERGVFRDTFGPWDVRLYRIEAGIGR